jgi:hypothetical protein
MRLTLRTLLSYRDGVLPPKAHEELGQKLRNSQTAQDLANRIDRALAQPKPLANELAELEQTCPPNEVSEFLDGTMALDRVFAMERKCIASNAILAELASVHSILARELLGTSKNPSNQPTQAFLGRLHALHDPKDRVVGERPGNDRSSSPSKTGNHPLTRSPAMSVPPGASDAFGAELEDRLGDNDSKPVHGLIVQTIFLLILLAILAWWILHDTSILPPMQPRMPSTFKGV